MKPTPKVIGRSCIVRDSKQENTLVGATVIDAIAGTNKAKRVRITTGPFSGEVRFPAEYTLVEFCEGSEVAGALAMAWAD